MALPWLLAWSLLAASPAAAFLDERNCGLFEPEPRRRDGGVIKVDDRIVNGYKVWGATRVAAVFNVNPVLGAGRS